MPALFAALFATATAVLGAVPETRRVALSGTLSGSSKAAVDRYSRNAASVESRWLILRVLGVASSAVLIHLALPPSTGASRLALAVVGVILTYAVPAEVGIALSTRRAEQVMPYLLHAVRPFELLVAPIAIPLHFIGRLASRVVERPRTPSTALAESEVEILVTEGELNGSLAHDQSEMIRNVLEFGDIRAGDVMVPRTQMTALDVEMLPEEALQVIAKTAHSRYPVYRDRIDNIVGVLHVRDVAAFAATGDLKTMKIDEVMQAPVVFVPESQSASSVLMDMRAGSHMAIIIDEFGGISGLITLEDLMEEIVGDIRDEHDDEEPPIVDLGNGRLMVDARVSIDDLSRYLGVALPEDRDYNSLGGFLVDRMGQVPEVGTVLSDFGMEFVVRVADERHIAKVEIVRLAPNPDSIPPQSSSRSAA